MLCRFSEVQQSITFLSYYWRHFKKNKLYGTIIWYGSKTNAYLKTSEVGGEAMTSESGNSLYLKNIEEPFKLNHTPWAE